MSARKDAGSAPAANEPDVTEDRIVPGTFRVCFEAEYDVECEFDPDEGVSSTEIKQLLQDALGYTGIVVTCLTEYEEIP